MSAELLPQNATPLEKALAEVLDTRGRLTPELARVPTLTVDPDTIPDDWLPWVIADEGLSILQPYLPPREVLREGRPWKAELGSSTAILRALGWKGLTGTLHYEPDEDENFDLFQVELSSPVRPETVPLIQRLVTISKPTTDILARVFSGYDARPFRLDYSRLDGPDLLDNWSGVRLEPDGPVVSFGAVEGGEVAFDFAVVEAASSALMAGQVQVEDGFMLDVSRLDDEVVEPGVIEIEVAQTAAVALEANLKSAPWPAGSWPGFSWSDFETEVFGGYDGDTAD